MWTDDPILREKFKQRDAWDVPSEEEIAQARREAEADEKLKENLDEQVREAYPEPVSGPQMAAKTYPPIIWTVESLIRQRVVRTLDGDAGVGKSLTGEGLSVGVAAGVPIFGKQCIKGPVLWVSHEDDEADIKAGLDGYCDYLGTKLADLPDLHVWSLQEHDMTRANIKDDGSWTKGPFYAPFVKKLKQHPGAFVTLDCRSDVSQMNEFLREPPNTFYKTILTALCIRYDVTILVLCHPSKAAMKDGTWYSGGTGNKSALRNKLVERLVDKSPTADPDGPREFGVLKRNRGKRDDNMIVLTFDKEREIFVASDDAAVRAKSEDKHDKIVAKIKDLLKSGLIVQKNNKGQGMGPRDVATALLEVGVTVAEAQVKSSMTRALVRRELGYRNAAPGGRIPAGFKLDPDPIIADENPSDFEPGGE